MKAKQVTCNLRFPPIFPQEYLRFSGEEDLYCVFINTIIRPVRFDAAVQTEAADGSSPVDSCGRILELEFLLQCRLLLFLLHY